MSSKDVSALVEMGASRKQAIAALAKHKTLNEAAEAIFSGEFETNDGAHDEVEAVENDICQEDDGCVITGIKWGSKGSNFSSFEERDEAIDDTANLDDSGDDDGFDLVSNASHASYKDADPYLGLSMDKDREEMVIEIVEEPNTFTLDLTKCGSCVKVSQNLTAKEITQSEWLRGCPEGGEQTFLFGLYLDATKSPLPCPKCKHPNERRSKEVFAMLPSIENYLECLVKTVIQRCVSCSADICIGCGEETCESIQPTTPLTKRKENDKDTSSSARLFHCPELQAIILGVGLIHLEQLSEEQTKMMQVVFKEAKSGSPSKKPKFSPENSFDGCKVSVTSKKRSTCGVGFGGSDSGETLNWRETQRLKVKKQDEALRQGLETLRPFLPNLARDSPHKSDYLPHVASIAHLRRRFLPIASRLLDGASLNDMCERHELFEELVEGWFKCFAMHESLAALLAQPTMLPVAVEIRARGDTKERHVTYRGSKGPRELAQSVKVQCEGFLYGVNLLKRNGQDKSTEQKLMGKSDTKSSPKKRGQSSALASYINREVAKDPQGATIPISTDEASTKPLDDESQHLVNFAQSFCDYIGKLDERLRKTKGNSFVDRLIGIAEASTRSGCTSTNPDGRQSSSGTAEADLSKETDTAAYELWARRVGYDECDMTLPTSAQGDGKKYAHAFNKEILLVSAADNSKRGITIARELGGLRNSLPNSWHSSVFLRVDAGRVDVLKACIVGPQGSPYQDGLFVFDIFLPADYNKVSPKAVITTTGGGKIRFNPNLYACGKVCLSLLGTWSGPGWVSGQSTLLQVLLSIQSLVMGVEEPALNEPGWSSHAGSSFSKAYSKNCRRQTLTFAMYEHLKHPDPLWKDIINGHFRLKRAAIFELLDKWLDEDDGRSLLSDGSSLHYDVRASDTMRSKTEKEKGEFAKKIKQVKDLIDQIKEDGQIKEGVRASAP